MLPSWEEYLSSEESLRPNGKSRLAAGPAKEVAPLGHAARDYLQFRLDGSRGEPADVNHWYDSHYQTTRNLHLFRDLHQADPGAAYRLAQAVTTMPEVGRLAWVFVSSPNWAKGRSAKSTSPSNASSPVAMSP